MATSSTVARWELAHRIKVRRHELGIGVDQIAKHLGFTRNFFSAVENERSMLATDKLEVLLVMLEFDDDERAELMALDAAARDRGWWEAKEVTDLFGDAGARYMGLEQGARRISTYDSLVIPGLLQLPEYTKAVLESDPYISQLRLTDFLKHRARRVKEISSRVSVVALVSEACLHQRWGPNDLHQRQLSHVLQCTRTFADLTVRVLTFDSSPGVLVSSSTLSLVSFSSPHLPDVCYQEAVRDLETLSSDTPEYQRLSIAYQRALDLSRSHEESLSLIRSSI